MGTGKNRPAVKQAAKTQKRTGAVAGKTATRSGRRRGRASSSPRVPGDPALFEPLTEGERADALRLMVEDKRLATMAKVGRYRVIAVEPLVVKPPHPLSGRRLVHVVVYDYASDRCVETCVDLEGHRVEYVNQSKAQPMLAREEELAAIDIAVSDERVASALSLGDEALAAMHYWSDRDTELSYSRRSAAVIFGQPGARPSLVAVVNLIDSHVAEIVSAENW